MSPVYYSLKLQTTKDKGNRITLDKKRAFLWLDLPPKCLYIEGRKVREVPLSAIQVHGFITVFLESTETWIFCILGLYLTSLFFYFLLQF